MRTYRGGWIILALFFLCITISGCASTESAEKKAYDDINNDLIANGYPAGMFGASWNMSQDEVKQAVENCRKLDQNTLIKDISLYDRPAQASFHFTNDRLMVIVVTFKDLFLNPDEFASAYYAVQADLALDYGTMPEPITDELAPPINKSMGRSAVH